jgi:hypothetical protein
MNGFIPSNPWNLVIFENFNEAQKKAYKQTAPFTTAPVKTDDAITAYTKVLSLAGATLPKRDVVDTRVINHVKTGTGRIIDDEDQVGGWPELKASKPPTDSDHDGMPDKWETTKKLNPANPDDRNGDLDSDGYTNLEEYLNSLHPGN